MNNLSWPFILAAIILVYAGVAIVIRAYVRCKGADSHGYISYYVERDADEKAVMWPFLLVFSPIYFAFKFVVWCSDKLFETCHKFRTGK